MIGVFLFIMLVSASARADSATQTDWLGGGGAWGPTVGWSNQFYESTGVNYFFAPSNISLEKPLLTTPIEHTVGTGFDMAISVHAADVNGDGFIDVLGAARNTNEITWWENTDGTGSSWIEHTVSSTFGGANSVYAEDVNGDGFMDVLGAAKDADRITWWENTDGTGTAWTEHIVDGAFNYAASVFAEDVNGDGFMDVLGAAMLAFDITWWENTDGTGTVWTEHTIDPSFSAAYCVHAADINGDNFVDVIGAAIGSLDHVSWWQNTDGTGTSWVERSVDSEYFGAASVCTADVNGDNRMDILGAASEANDICWWENTDGSGTAWTKHTLDGDFIEAFCVKAADLNGDGSMDVLGSSVNLNDITWWENADGSGTSWTEHKIADDFQGAISVCSADVNGDSYLDVLGAAVTEQQIAWWNLRGAYPTSGSLVSSVLDVENNADWQTIGWTSSVPTGTSVSFQVRASDNPYSMGSWSSILTAPGSIVGIVPAETRYIQYTTILFSVDPQQTPVLHDVTFGWNYTGIDDGAGPKAFTLYGAMPNPSQSSASLVFELPMASLAELTVYDLTGRTVYSVCGQYTQGVHEETVSNLTNGVYMVQMTSQNFTSSRYFVVIE